MAIVVMILGESGTGKSASMRNLDTNTTAVVNVIGKPFPFRKKGFETVSTDKYPEITAFLRKTDKKTIVIDDSQYLMGNEYMRRAQEKVSTNSRKWGKTSGIWSTSASRNCRRIPSCTSSST